MKHIVASFNNKFNNHRRVAIHLLILLILPPILSLIIGLEYSNKTPQVPIVIVNHDNSEIAQSLVQMFADNPSFHVVAYAAEDNEIENALYRGDAAAGVLIPSDFSQNILNGRKSSVMFFDDGALSAMNGTARNVIASTLGTIKNGYLVRIAEGQLGLSPEMALRTIAPMGYTTRGIGNPTNSSSYMMLEGILLTIVQVGIVAVGTTICEGKKYKRFLVKGMICALTGTAAGISCIAIQHFIYEIPYTGSVAAGISMMLLTSMGFSFFGMWLNRQNNGNVEKSISVASAISLTQLLSGYTYPLIAMPVFFQHLGWFIPNYHLILPLRDIALLGKTFGEETAHLSWLLGFAVIMMMLATISFFSRRSKAVSKQGQFLQSVPERKVGLQ